MTDLPTLKKPVPPIPQEDEEWCLRMISLEDPNDNRKATLEDVRAVLDAAGYDVVEQRVLKPGEKIEYDAPPPRVPKTTQEKVDWLKCLGFTSQQIYEIMDQRQECSACHGIVYALGAVCGKCMGSGKEPKTSGTPVDGAVGVEKGADTSRPAEGREEPGTVVPEFGEDRRALLVATPGKSGIRRATFADLHEVEAATQRVDKLAQAVLNGIMKWDWGVIQMGYHNYRGGTVGGMRVPPEGVGLPPKSSIEFKSKEEMLGWFRAVSEAINRADGEIIGAAKLHEQVRDLEAKVVALDRLAIDAIECVEAATYKGDGLVAGLKYRLESLK